MSFKEDLGLTFSEIGLAFGSWRGQVVGLAKKDLSKKTKRSALGWFWLFFQPVVYIACFWFALYVGIKHAKDGLDGWAYLLWLTSGIIPWWFMRGCLHSAPSCITRYKFLVNRLKFPLALIPIFTVLSGFMFQCILTCCLIACYFLQGNPVTPYLIQLPFVMILMFVFFVGYSMLTAPLCAISADVAGFLNAMVTPIFWLSGILFDTSNIDNPIVQLGLKVDPVAFFANSYRKILSGVDPGWIWDDPMFLILGLIVVFLTIILGVLTFAKLRKGLADVL